MQAFTGMPAPLNSFGSIHKMETRLDQHFLKLQHQHETLESLKHTWELLEQVKECQKTSYGVKNLKQHILDVENSYLELAEQTEKLVEAAHKKRDDARTHLADLRRVSLWCHYHPSDIQKMEKKLNAETENAKQSYLNRLHNVVSDHDFVKKMPEEAHLLLKAHRQLQSSPHL